MPRLPIVLAEHPARDVDVVLQDGDIDLIEAGIDVALRDEPAPRFSADGPQDRPLSTAVFPTGRQASAKARAFVSFMESQMSGSGTSALGSGRE
jgi:hypothetical protein